MDVVVCALDMAPTSKRVAAWAIRFARLLNCRLVLFHAIHMPSDPWDPAIGEGRGASLRHRRDQLHADMTEWMGSSVGPWQAEIVVGDPAEMMETYCRHHPVRWVITGSKGFKGVKRLFMGTVVERMARMLPCPMLVIRSAMHPAVVIENIAICCDRSLSGQLLAEYGSALADLTGAVLHLLHALEAAADPAFMDPSKAPYGKAQDELQSRIKKHLLAMVPDRLQQQGRIETHLSAGQAHDQLPSMVARLPCQLLIVGVRRRRALGQWISGSTTESMLRSSPCHVLVVPDQSKRVEVVDQAVPLSVLSAVPQTGIVKDPLFLAHRTPDGHPENHHRLEPIYALLDGQDDSPLVVMEPQVVGPETLALVHSGDYIRTVAQTATMASCQISADTFTCADTYAAACRAVGGVTAAIDAVLGGAVRNAFVLARPPGHHAEISRASGFCLFNNVAIGARYAREVKGLRKVLIVDWDLHHGNGTQHIFEEDPSVLYISSHQYPCFPGTGHYLEAGRGPGQGYTINLPLGKRWRNADFAALYQRLVVPVTLAFNPDLILVSAGFDIHRNDPLGRMRMTEEGFAAITRILMHLARRCCHERLVLVMEGGYDPNATASSVAAVLAELRGQTHTDLDRMMAKARLRCVEPVIHRCAHVVGHIWPDIH
jgi:acetoin utilization deacetylase AcuC-like enzyme/nucleotide-binding universal stress UspA family protein